MTTITTQKTPAFENGQRFAAEHASQGMDYTLAYSLAVATAIRYQKPLEFIRGFNSAWNAEEEKSMVA
jgi:hypothetical protein